MDIFAQGPGSVVAFVSPAGAARLSPQYFAMEVQAFGFIGGSFKPLVAVKSGVGIPDPSPMLKEASQAPDGWVRSLVCLAAMQPAQAKEAVCIPYVLPSATPLDASGMGMAQLSHLLRSTIEAVGGVGDMEVYCWRVSEAQAQVLLVVEIGKHERLAPLQKHLTEVVQITAGRSFKVEVEI